MSNLYKETTVTILDWTILTPAIEKSLAYTIANIVMDVILDEKNRRILHSVIVQSCEEVFALIARSVKFKATRTDRSIVIQAKIKNETVDVWKFNLLSCTKFKLSFPFYDRGRKYSSALKFSGSFKSSFILTEEEKS